jgi:phosphatidylglycerol---prolipoprotein diacylglyceryl transferase
MTQLPSFTWGVDPVFLRVPREFVILGLAAFTVVSLVIGLRKKAGDQLLTAAIFGGLAALAYYKLPVEFELRYYSALFLGVFLGGYSLLKWQITRGGGRAEDAGDFIVYGVLGVLVGARLGHIVFYDLKKAIDDPVWIFKIWTGGLASHGAVIGLITAMWIYCKRRAIPFLEGADRFSFSAALGATLVRVGNWFNSEIIGRKVPDQSWGVWFDRVDEGKPVYRYPTQLYEITLGLVVMAALYLVDKRLGKERRPRGVLISTFFALYFSGRFVIEFYKEYEGISPDSPLTMGQFLSLPGILLGLFGLYWSFKKRQPVGWPNPYALVDDDDDDAGQRVSVSRRKKKKSKAGKKKRKQGAAAPAASEEAVAEETESPAKAEPDHDDSDDRIEDERLPAEEPTEGNDDEGDDDESDDDESDDDEADKPAKTSGDPDIDDEFDADGKLRRRRT